MASYYGGPTLSREQAAQVLYQAGVRGEDLVYLVAVAERESGYNSGAHRTDSARESLSGDRGLWQINYTWDQQLMAAGIIRNKADLFDPLTNAKAAAYVLSKQGRDAWAMGSNGYQSGGNPLKGVNMSTAQAAVSRAQAQGLLGQDWASGSSGATTAAAGGTIPADGRVVNLEGNLGVVFSVSPGVSIFYRVADSSAVAGRPVQTMTSTQYGQQFGAWIDGGSSEELAEIPAAFGSYTGYVNAILDQMFPAGDPRRADPEIMRVLATRAGRPDMTEAEFENLLKGTQYYQARTEGQLRWNDLSEAERQTQREDMAARMQQVWQQFGGDAIDASNAIVAGYLEQVASGKMGFGAWTEQVVKPVALQHRPEGPYARQVRDEQEAQRARPIEIENTVGQLRQTLDRWGWSTDETSLRYWATQLVEKKMSDDDINQIMDEQASILYAGKPKGMETIVYAAPWIETYNRVMERQGSLKTPEIAKALSAFGRDPDNNDPWAFEQQLKSTAAYDGTKGGQTEAWEQTSELVGMLGF